MKARHVVFDVWLVVGRNIRFSVCAMPFLFRYAEPLAALKGASNTPLLYHYGNLHG